MASLTLAVAAVGSSYDLTALGTADWFAYPNSTTPVRKTGTALLASARVGTGGANTAYSGGATFSWSNGTPTASGSSTGGIFMNGFATGTGYVVTAPADTTLRTLRILAGAYNAAMEITATLSDGSVAAVTNTQPAAGTNAGFSRVLELQYAAAGPGQTLSVNILTAAPSTSTRNISLSAAMLSVGAPTGGGLPTVTSVAVSPATANLAGGATQQYSAVVNGTNTPPQGVTWKATLGTIDVNGLYKAPSAATATQTDTITATSSYNAAVSDTATATIAALPVVVTPPAPVPTMRFDFPAYYDIEAAVFEPPPDIISVTVVPASATMEGGESRQFSALVEGAAGADLSVTWSSEEGAISATGLFIAPASTTADQRIAVRATSTQNPTKWGEARVFVPAAEDNAPLIDSVSISPSLVEITGGGSVKFLAMVTGPNNPSQAGTWATNLGTISVDGTLQAPPAIVREQVGTVTFTSSVDPTRKAVAQFVVAALTVVQKFVPSSSRTVRILPGRLAFVVGSHWTLSTAGPVGPKDPNAIIDIPFDWSAWLADIGSPSLDLVEFFLGGGLKEEGIVPDVSGGTVLVSGGVPGTSATVTCRITTATTPSRTDDRTVVLQIRDQ